MLHQRNNLDEFNFVELKFLDPWYDWFREIYTFTSLYISVSFFFFFITLSGLEFICRITMTTQRHAITYVHIVLLAFLCSVVRELVPEFTCKIIMLILESTNLFDKNSRRQ